MYIGIADFKVRDNLLSRLSRQIVVTCALRRVAYIVQQPKNIAFLNKKVKGVQVHEHN